jgi:hypothetical protein
MADINEHRPRLYATGGTGAANRAITALRGLWHVVADRVQSQVIDVLLPPELMLDMVYGQLPAPACIAPGQVVRVMTRD